MTSDTPRVQYDARTRPAQHGTLGKEERLHVEGLKEHAGKLDAILLWHPLATCVSDVLYMYTRGRGGDTPQART